MWTHHAVFLVFLLGIGALPAAAQDRQEFWGGTRTMKAADGRALPSSETLVNRSYRPGENLVIDHIIDVDPSGGTLPTQYTLRYKMDGQSFAITEDGGAFRGTGSWRGKATNWSGWTAELIVADGTRIAVEAKLTKMGLRVSKSVADPRGTILATVDEKIDLITQAVWKKRCTVAMDQLAASRAPYAALARTEHYRGVSRVTRDDGSAGSELELLVRRRYDPIEGRIEQTTATIDPTGRYPATQTRLDFDINLDGRFQVKDRSKAYTAHGRARGEAWAWGEYSTSGRLVDGSTVEVEDRIGPKDLHSESIFRGADRQELFRVSSELTAISAEEFTKRVRAVFSGLDVDAATGPAPRERYFAGKTRTLPDGKGLAVETETLLQLVFDRATGKITHFAVKVDPKGVAAPMALHLTFLVDGETFRIEAASKAAAGTGRLHGPAWGWSRIDREMTLPDGSRLVSSETLLEDGSLSADQTLHRPDGTKAFRFEDRLLPISGFEWSRRLQEANRR